MKIITSIGSIQSLPRPVSGRRVLVPTMGALHDGHAALIRKARQLAGRSGQVVVSIFVNPSQFGPGEDFSRYPRPAGKDAAICASLGIDVLFRPSAKAMYPGEESVWVSEEELSRGLCGASRPGHFRGVCTVVAKLFHLVGPDVAVFGEKDYQQLVIIRQMVRDLNFPVKIAGAPIARELDGLARSSRNIHLTAKERAEAPRLYRALLQMREAFDSGERRPARLLRILQKALGDLRTGQVDYAGIVDASTLRIPAGKISRPARALVAAWFGKTRLIDNLGLE